MRKATHYVYATHWSMKNFEGEKRKDRKTQKSRSEEKVVDFSSASLFTARKQEAVTNMINHPMQRKTQGVSIIKGWEDKQDLGCIPDNHIKQE